MDSGWITWVILGAVIVVLVIMFTYTGLKDMVKKRKRIKREKELAIKAEKYALEIFLKLDYLIIKNQMLIDEFEPSIGKYKMSEITDVPRNYLLELQKTEDFKELIIASHDVDELLKIYISYRDSRSTTWKSSLKDLEKIIQKRINAQNFLISPDHINSIKAEIDEYYQKQLDKKEE
ncbi:MHJ_0274 family protein [Mycoplasma sp. Mirounga ES2805-ORL]|uniref:MHJ_0274 family protein n=1 Tax=Mycoplasma sp. Mirounga ES2805-ORL TaxID=754514 RepID=UPI00197CB4A7|nr:hypothetical protein [Mycoplasma sp. Mirounga ES2805-ORL]QSF13838.1 hypothetical protein JXZ90_00860 [Mycoplasma sp. Mirounga ES2805-ORL]